jgi:cysteine desulfurase
MNSAAIDWHEGAEAVKRGSSAPAVRQIYFDHNASAPVPAEVVAAMRPYLHALYGNPSSGHWAAQGAVEAVETARGQVAGLLGCAPENITFTGGGTEANNMALKGIWHARGRKGSHIISSAIEHDAILKPLQFLRRQGAKVTLLGVDRFGRVDPDALRAAITPETCLISIMLANNEVGTIQPVAELAAIARARGIPFHTDAAQALGKIAVDVEALGVDMLSLAGHKFGAPKGIGAFYLREGVRIEPFMHGAGHERGRRAGTESALLAAGIGAAAERAAGKSSDQVRVLRDYFWGRLRERFGAGVVLNGHPEQRVPNTLSVCFPDHAGADVLARLDGVAATTGSACHAGCVTMSHVLIAMNVPTATGMGAIRFSLGDGNSREEVDAVVAMLGKALG